MSELKAEIAQVKEQQEQAKALWTKYQGIIEYLEGKLEAEKKSSISKKEQKSKK